MWNLLWLIVAFVPAVVALITGEELLSNKPFWVMNIICSMVAGVGVCRAAFGRRIVRGSVGFVTGLFIFGMTSGCLVALNVMIALYKGCCSEGGLY